MIPNTFKRNTYGALIVFTVTSYGWHLNQPHQPEPKPAQVIVSAYEEVTLEHEPIDDSLFCLSEAIYHEARGESLDGRKSVANVILNRVESKHFPDTICEVVNQPYQFSYTLNRPEIKDDKSWEEAERIANLVMNRDYDRTNGALYYYNPRKLAKAPAWADEKHFIRTADSHRLYAWHKVAK